MSRVSTIGLMMLLALSLGTPAVGQAAGPPPDAPRLGLGLGLGGDGLQTLRIVKGTIDRISDDFLVLDVESIHVPREGPMENPPDTVKVSLSDSCRFVRAGEPKASAEDFSVGDAVVALTTYEGAEGYSLRVLLDPQSAVKLREMIGQRLGGDRDGRARMGPGGPGGPGMAPGRPGDVLGRFADRQLPPLLVGTYLGTASDGSVRLKLTGMLVRQPQPMMGRRGAEDEGAPRGEDRAADRGKRYHEFPEPKEVTVQMGEGARLFADGEKASLRDFKSGDEIVAIIRGRPATGEEASLVLMADRESAGKLMKLLLERARRGRQGGSGERPAEPGAF